MKVLIFHENAKLPTKGTEGAGAYDIYMPEAGFTSEHTATRVALGFAAQVPEGYVAMIFPRSGIGAKHGLELNNTCGIIDSDYRGEWIASLKTKNYPGYGWAAGDRILQYVLVPVLDSPPERVLTLTPTRRGTGGFGSTG
jgi:dUTP pyrophosphatase